MGTLENYLKQFAKLRVDSSRARWSPITKYCAPHKPLLLLAVLDLFSQGSIASNLIEISPDLGELFNIYWSKVVPPGHRANLALPFFHLKSEGFWHLLPIPGRESFLAAVRQIRSVNQLHKTVLGAKLDSDLYDLFCDKDAREALRVVLVEIYFADGVQKELIEQGFVNFESFRYAQTLLGDLEKSSAKDILGGADMYASPIRDQGFRRAIITAYNHRCAFCGIRMLTPDGHTVLEAAHIVPWSISHNDDPCNGLGLCRLCHWAFDEGLLGVSSEYAVTISPELNNNDNIPGQVLALAERPILGPSNKVYWPDLDALRWHRQNVFRRL